MAEIKYEVIQKYGIISESSKGVTLSAEELLKLKELLNSMEL